MRLLRVLPTSLRALLAHRTRSALAAAGMAVGIGAVFVTSAVARGAADELLGDLAGPARHLLVVRPITVKRSAAHRELRGAVSTLKPEDWRAIEDLESVEEVAPVAESRGIKVKSDARVVSTSLLGTTEAFFRIRCLSVHHRGMRFDDEGGMAPSRIVVLGGRIAASLFPETDPVGRDVRIAGIPFEVVGVLAPRGVAADGADIDDQVFVPIGTAMRRVLSSRSLDAVFVGARGENLDAVERDVRSLLRERHRRSGPDRPDDFTLQNQKRFLAAQRKAGQALVLFTSGLAVVALVVGGTGILALMLLSVRERTAEIGLRMAVGARPKDIMLQFTLEAVVLALVGGLAGICVGMLGTWSVSGATGWSVRVSYDAVGLAVAMAATVGAIFGVLPAWLAARLPPLRALARH